MFYVQLENNTIVSKGITADDVILNEKQIEVTEEIYNQIGNYRAECTFDENGNILSVGPIENPNPIMPTPTVEERLATAENTILGLMNIIMMNGGGM